ncbi:MAG TPA: flagellin, partial [Polyangia bacterium]|nr:flagellin [Polyangia bacterium]
IRDVDVAEETSNMSRTQILMQAGVSVLAQANQMPQVALKLLG